MGALANPEQLNPREKLVPSFLKGSFEEKDPYLSPDWALLLSFNWP